MSDTPWFTITVDFAAKDYNSAEAISECVADVICGGEIGCGLHVCKPRNWVMSFGPQKEYAEYEGGT